MTPAIEAKRRIIQNQADSLRLLARKSHLAFMHYCWIRDRKTEPFIPGFHTRQICKRLDKAFEDFRNGISTNLIINVHPRAGKSDIGSIYLGPHFLGEFPSKEIIQTTYEFGLAEINASLARNVYRSVEYSEIYPDMGISTETNQKANWIITKDGIETGGKFYASGMNSGITGHGAALAIVDDFFAGKKEAESKTQRDRVWDILTNDIMTRFAPVHIFIMLNTQWHVDDPNGRIENYMEQDPDFPRFEIMKFPAKREDYRGPGSYPEGNRFLFEEKYPRSWYLNAYAFLGKYSAPALMDCNPIVRTGSILHTTGIEYVDEVPDNLHLRWARVWDLAHTGKQRQGDDPDWTSGTKLAFERRPGDPVLHLWIANVFRTRDGATERDEKIKVITEGDSKFVTPAIEVSVDAKDADQYLRKALPQFAWQSIKTEGDKTVRATPLEPIFDAPNHVHVLRGDWNAAWLSEVMNFDGSGKGHDDQIDNMSAGYILLVENGRAIMSDETKAKLAARRNRGQ